MKTVHKNNEGAEILVNRLDRAFQKYKSYNPFGQVFKKQPSQKVNGHSKKANKAKKNSGFKVQSPEQIVIKCARAAYARSLLSKERVVVEEES